jgi:hypothetical protein
MNNTFYGQQQMPPNVSYKILGTVDYGLHKISLCNITIQISFNIRDGAIIWNSKNQNGYNVCKLMLHVNLYSS